jgi:competence protein ComEC
MARGTALVSERALAAACERADIVISERYLPRSCRPRWLRADRDLLQRTGGLTVDLTERQIETVAQGEGDHGWWNPPKRLPRRPNAPQPSESADADAASAVAKPGALRAPTSGVTQAAPPA